MQSEYGPLTETQNEEFHKMAKLVESHDKEGQFNSFIDKLCDGPLDRIKKKLYKYMGFGTFIFLARKS